MKAVLQLRVPSPRCVKGTTKIIHHRWHMGIFPLKVHIDNIVGLIEYVSKTSPGWTGSACSSTIQSRMCLTTK